MEIFNTEPIQVGIFQDVLETITTDTPVMIELGCAYAEYSKLFSDYFSDKCVNICIDILPRQLVVAEQNCPNATIMHGYAGEPVHLQEVEEDNHGAQRIYLKDLIGDKKINILHMDIQGSETYVMQELYELDEYMSNIEYIFVSLHQTYEKVKKYIPNNFEYLYEHPTEGGLGDGLIVIKNKNFIS